MPFLVHDDDVRELAPETNIGSGAQATWRIANQDLAGRHFSIRLGDDAKARLTPATPQSVVVVNGKQVPPAGTDLQSGDLIAAGNARFIYIVDQSAPRPTLPPPLAEAFLADPDGLVAYRLRKRAVTIGRDAASGIVLRDPTVSRHHADVRAEAGGHVIYSSGSMGTTVRGYKITAPRFLNDGDEIHVGSATLAYSTKIPTGLRVVDPAGAHEDRITRRDTVLQMRAQTGEVARLAERRPIPLIAVVGVLVVIALIIWLLLTMM